MRLTALLPMVIAAGCMPELTSPPGGELDLADWLPPENSWDAADTLPATSPGSSSRPDPDVPMDSMARGQPLAVLRQRDRHRPLHHVGAPARACQARGRPGRTTDQGFMYLTMPPENRPATSPTRTTGLGDPRDHRAHPLGQRGLRLPDRAQPGRPAGRHRADRVQVNPVVPAEDPAIRAAIENALELRHRAQRQRAGPAGGVAALGVLREPLRRERPGELGLTRSTRGDRLRGAPSLPRRPR